MPQGALVMTSSSVPAIPDYRISHEIGRGACGTVWLAEEILSGVRVALKVLPKKDSGASADISRELAGLRHFQRVARQHPHLIQIHHVGESSDSYYYAMEAADPVRELPVPIRADGKPHGQVPIPSFSHSSPHIRSEGPPNELGGHTHANVPVKARYRPQTLASLIEQEAPLSATRALDVADQILKGLSHLHENGLVHRDVKPSNILLVGGLIKLGDPGLVTNSNRDVTIVGTPGYLPNDWVLDHTADLYATGIILYELITGLPRSRFPELPASLSEAWRDRRPLRTAIRIANKAAHPQKSQRYQRAHDISRDIGSGRGPRPNSIRWSALAVLAVLIAIGVLSFWLMFAPKFRLSSVRTFIPPGHVEPAKSVELAFQDGSTMLFTFPATIGDAISHSFEDWGRSRVVVGFDKPAAGRIMAFTPFLSRLTGSIIETEVHELYVPPPAEWDHQVFGMNCSIAGLRSINLDGRPGNELVVTVHYPEAPTRIMVFTRGWRLLSEFWHYGHFDLVECADLYGTDGQPGRDGLPELIVHGNANRVGRPDERIPQTQRLAQAERQHYFIMILDPRGPQSPEGQFSMNAWMNERTPRRPLSYGYLKYHRNENALGGGWFVGDDSPKVLEGRGLPISVTLRNGLLLELSAALKPRPLRWNSPAPDPPPIHKLPDTDEVWIQIVPEDESDHSEAP